MTIDVTPVPNYIPSGFRTVNVMLAVKNAQHALEFYNRAFNAQELMRLTDPAGRILHAEIKINDSILMLTEDDGTGGNSSIIQLYVGDAEGFFEEAINAGCVEVYPLKKQFYGDRAGRVKDPFGHQWIIATHMEDVSPREMQKRFQKLFQ